jgi:hypothetical protein
VQEALKGTREERFKNAAVAASSTGATRWISTPEILEMVARIVQISGSNNDQLGDTQAILEAQLDDTIGDVRDEYEGYRVKALIKPH